MNKDWILQEITGFEKVLTNFSSGHKWFKKLFGRLLVRIYWPKNIG